MRGDGGGAPAKEAHKMYISASRATFNDPQISRILAVEIPKFPAWRRRRRRLVTQSRYVRIIAATDC